MSGSAPANRPTAGVFRFLDATFDPATGETRLAYAFDDGPPLVETLVFPAAPPLEDPARAEAFDRALSLLHLVAGVSYWKALLPQRIEVGAGPLSPAERGALPGDLAAFLEKTWTLGLGEFAFVNGIDPVDLDRRARFPAGERGSGDAPPDLGLPARALVAMGGGKDSLVSLETLRQIGVEVQPAVVGASTLIAETVAVAELPLLRIERHLAPELMRLNAAGAWNGHVPVTAINMAILACAAILYGHRWVVFSNERSAEEPTLHTADGEPVNHQYSKSLEFERAFRGMIRRYVARDLEVFSLLRDLGEAAVTRRFAELPAYHGVFSSCNRNFHRDGSRNEGRWCGHCPKCRFTSLALAPWLSPGQVTAIVGGNLLDDPSQEAGFRELAALGRDKPFECVGTAEESRALLARLSEDPAWRDCAVVRRLAREVSEDAGRLEGLLTASGPDEIPAELAESLPWR
ncbi:MAG: endonuclease domain-containing protein [Xanthomonadales bacterium]|jgi:hypothetical protein|nr:endonuclease domain-containing protein [Xanthomonadales bacterium]